MPLTNNEQQLIKILHHLVKHDQIMDKDHLLKIQKLQF